MLRVIGRILLGCLFIFGGAGTVIEPSSRVIMVEESNLTHVRESATQATVLNGVIMVIAGSALALNILPRLAASFLLTSLVPTTFIGHPFWKESDPGKRSSQQIHFMKNLAILGGLFFIVSEKKAKAPCCACKK